MKRREFITLLGGAAVAWPVAARAQQGEPLRRIGILMYVAADDTEARLAAFTQVLKQLGWSEGRNLRAALAPDVLVADIGTPTVAPLLQATRTVPIVFVTVIDPVGAGFVASLAKPGGNATGFTIYEYSMSGKWLELLKEIAPNVTRVAVLRDPAVASGTGQFGAVQRILKGEKPADLPVQAPTKYELVINLKTAKALGLAMPPAVLGRADEVIE